MGELPNAPIPDPTYPKPWRAVVEWSGHHCGDDLVILGQVLVWSWGQASDSQLVGSSYMLSVGTFRLRVSNCFGEIRKRTIKH